MAKTLEKNVNFSVLFMPKILIFSEIKKKLPPVIKGSILYKT
jgi:hypothetical protein